MNVHKSSPEPSSKNKNFKSQPEVCHALQNIMNADLFIMEPTSTRLPVPSQLVSSHSNVGWKTRTRSSIRHRRRKRLTPNFCSAYRNIIINHVQRYCEETTLHGIRYISNARSIYAEKLLWCVVCVSCMYVSISMMKLVWNRFQESPTVTTVETTNFPIWNIPFPAVTLCNNNKVYLPAALSLIGNLSEQLQINDSVLSIVVKLLPSLISPRKINLEHVKMVQTKLFKAGYKLQDLMLQLAVPCDVMLKRCIWQDVDKNCSDLFHVANSVLGPCCSFNYHGVKEEFRIGEGDKNDVQFVSGSGLRAGLTVILNVDQQTYYAPLRPFYGIMVLFHDPLDYPETSLQTAVVEPQMMVTIGLGAQAIESAPEVRTLNVAQRQCWFDDEVSLLNASPEYSYQTCITECRMEVLNSKCGCTPFFYPMFNKSARICDITDTDCLLLYRRITSGLFPRDQESEYGNDGNDAMQIGMNCSCFPQCSDKSYSLSKEIVKLQPELSSMSGTIRRIPNASVLHVHFSEFTCMKYARNAYMTWDSVFATFGGIFGLCMGGSVISLFELGYRFLLMLGAGCKAMLRSKPPKARENIVLPWSMEPEKHHLKLFHTKSSSKLCNFNKNSGF